MVLGHGVVCLRVDHGTFEVFRLYFGNIAQLGEPAPLPHRPHQ
ncbi:hypothetical protein ABZ490_50765 [Streptomyces sp. NPDC005811]